MFDVGFSEIVIIAIVALIVIGPERLPAVARTLGHLLGRMQRYVNDVKADITREMELDELRKLQSSVEDSARSIEQAVNREVDAAQSQLSGVEQALKQEAAEVQGQIEAKAGGDATATAAASTAPAEAEKGLEVKDSAQRQA
jgi:sec-independent protein translocase protein TatB